MNHRNPAVRLVRNLRLTTESHDLGIVHHARHHPRRGIGEDLGIGVDHEDHLVLVGRDTGAPPERVEELVLEQRHAFVEHDLLEERHEDDLRVSLASVSRFRVLGLGCVPDLGDEQHRDALLLADLDRVVVVLVESRKDLGSVVSLVAVRDGNVRQRLDVVRWHDEVLHHPEDEFGCRERVFGSLDHAVGDDEDDLVRVGVVGRRE